jgi:vancomycin resistance protein YoaR
MVRNSRNSAVLLGIGGVLLLSGAGLLGGYFLGVQNAAADGRDVAAESGDRPVTDADRAEVLERTEEFLAKPVVVSVGDRVIEVDWADLGAAIDKASIDLARLDDAGQLSGSVPVTLDEARVREVLASLKAEIDRPRHDAYLDLENRKVVPGRPGVVVDIYGSTEVLTAAARAGKSEAELVTTHLPAEVSNLGIDDISTVLARFSTKYKLHESRRNDNLKLLASRIDGYVMKPGEVFSFNEVSGARSEKEGYKMAHVISSGEMVDGMAGGACQISTTLHAAAFFAGIEVVESVPHSRPSTYITLGLDATVVYPTTDLKLRNSYDFPVAIHYKVARGEAVVEILGAKKPFDEIKFERVVQKRIPFETITREDNAIGIGHMVTDQKGEYGFKVKRFRKILKDGDVVKKDTWDLAYRPVIEYVRMGTNPDPNLPPPKQKRGH